MNPTATTPAENQGATLGAEPAITGTKKEGEEENPLTKQVATLTADVERLSKELNQTRTLQGQSDRKARQEAIERKKVEAELRRIQRGEEPFIPKVGEEISATAIEQKVLVKGLVAETILRNKEYQTILETDPTLKDVLLTNPLALVEDALDTEDALNQIREKLDSRVDAFRNSQKKTEEPKKGEGAMFEAGPINPTAGEPAKITTPSEKALGEGDIEKSILSKMRIT